MSGLERLGLRVASMINSPAAQLQRRVLVHRLDTDADQDWHQVLEMLAETEGLEVTTTSDGAVLLAWDHHTDDDRVAEERDVFSVEGPAPF